jgi:hypothetical protein
MQEREYKMVMKWVKPKGMSMVLVDDKEFNMIIKSNEEQRNHKKKKTVKKDIKEEIEDGSKY